MKKTKEEFSISELVAIFAPKVWIIVIAALVLSLALGVYSAFIKTETYSSTATMMVSKNGTSLSTGDIDVATEMVKRCKVVIFRNNFLNKVLAEIKNNPLYAEKDWDIDVSYLKSVITLEQCGDTEAFEITATTPDPELSIAIADALAMHIMITLPESMSYPKDLISSKMIDPPVLALSPNSNHALRNALIGFVVGAVVAMVAIFVLSLFDVTIRDRKKLEDSFDIPVLGVIPRYLSEEGNK